MHVFLGWDCDESRSGVYPKILLLADLVANMNKSMAGNY